MNMENEGLSVPRSITVEFCFMCREAQDVHTVIRRELSLSAEGAVSDFDFLRMLDGERRRGDRLRDVMVFEASTGQVQMLSLGATSFSGVRIPASAPCYHDLNGIWVFLDRPLKRLNSSGGATVPASPPAVSTAQSHKRTFRARAMRAAILGGSVASTASTASTAMTHTAATLPARTLRNYFATSAGQDGRCDPL